MLKNIEFEFALCQVLNITPIPRVLIRWDLRTTTQNLKDIRFVVYRGEDPESMFPISPQIPHDALYEYIDNPDGLKNFRKTYYYQVVAREYCDGEILQGFASSKFTWKGDLDLIGVYIVEEHEFKYRYIAGAPVMVMKRKRDEVNCPDCFDIVLKRVTKSNCQVCYGTGKLGGFYAPVPIWMDLNPDPQATAIAEFGEKQIGQSDGELTNYPLINNGDIILEVMPNILWRVESVFTGEKRQTVNRQLVRLSKVNKNDIEYRIPIDEEMRIKLVNEFEDIRKEREF